jgi:chemotaxis protein CheD
VNATEIMVRMGELAFSRTGGDVLVAIGLGSCIGLALIDRKLPIAGLAHVMLPEAPNGDADAPGKFADLAVPALREELVALGASPSRLDAVLVGGAQMFSFGQNGGSRLDVGSRNEEAVRTALETARIPVKATATAGKTGRTVRVHVENGVVLVKEAGQPSNELFAR